MRSSRALSSTKGQGHHQHPHTFWAVVSIVIFPFVFLIVTTLGYDLGFAFASSLFALLMTLFMNLIMEGGLWMFAPHWRAYFENPFYSRRLVIVAVALFFMIQTGVLFLFLTSQALDVSVLRFLYRRNCLMARTYDVNICDFMERPYLLERSRYAPAP